MLTLWVWAEGQARAAELLADYQFDFSLESAVPGAPSLVHLGTNSFNVAEVDGQSRTVLEFARNDGLALSAAGLLDAPEGYTLVMLFRFNEVSGRRRILDFHNATNDAGLYCVEGRLSFSGQVSGSPVAMGAGQFVQVVLSRGADAWVNGYVDGAWEFSFFDVGGLALPGLEAVLRLFRDEDPVAPGEASAGAIARLRVYRGVLDSIQIANLDRLPDEAPSEIRFEASEVIYDESSGFIAVWGIRTGSTNAQASVQWSVVGGSASLPGDVDFVGPSVGTLVFEPGETRRDIQLLIVHDEEVEGDETVLLQLHDPVGAALGEPSQVVVTIRDDDQPQTFQADLSLFKWAASDVAAVGQPVSFTVELHNSGPVPASGVVVEDPLPAGVELAGWNVSPGTSFEPAEGRWSVPLLEPDSGAFLELTLVRSSPGTVTNRARIASSPVIDPTPWDHEAWAAARWEPEGGLAVLQFETAALSVSEQAGQVAVRVLRLGDTNGLSTVRYAIGGLATAGVDFLPPASGELVFGPGDIWQDLVLVVLDDALFEGVETVELTLHDPTGASLGEPSQAVVTLLDNDQPQAAEADLSLFKGADTNLAEPGQPIWFEIALQSAGPAVSSNVVVQELIPPETALVGWLAEPGTDFNPTNAQWTLPLVGPGTTNRLALALVKTNAGAVTNVAFVLQSSHPDPTLADRTNAAAARWAVPDVTDLALGLQLQTNRIGVGQTVLIEMVVTNLGPRAASNLTVLAPVPPGTEFVRTPPFQNWSFNPLTGRWQRTLPPFPTLEVGRETRFSMEVRATNAGTFPVTAQITASEPPDSVAANNAASNSLTVVRLANLAGSVRCGSTNGPALAAVTVSLVGSNEPPQSVVTGADGTFVFSNLAVGPYTLSASTNGYGFSPTNLTVDLQATTNLPPWVATPRFVVAEVRAGGTAVPGIAVQLTGAAAAQGLTDAAGRAVFTNLNPGVYVLTPLTNGQPAARFSPTNFTVTLGSPTNCDPTARFRLTSPAVILRALEVNQAVQDWENSVPLVQDKRTVVRAHLQLPEGVTNPVPVAGARLRGFRGGAELQILGGGFGLSPINPGGSLTLAHTNAAVRAVRERFGRSLNFRLPDLWTHGELELRLEWTNGVLIPREPAETGGRAGDAAVRLTFTEVPRAQVDFYRIRYVRAGVTNEPSSEDVDDLIRRLDAIYPMFRRVSMYHSLPLDFVPNSTNLSRVNDRLDVARRTNVRRLDHPRRLAYGVIVGRDVGGKARGIPGDVSCGSMHTDVYGHNRHAHEIGHSLGRPHAADRARFGVTNGQARGVCGEVADTNAPAFPHFSDLGGRWFARLGPINQGDDKLVYGLNTREGELFYRAVPDPARVPVISPFLTAELMSYCQAFTGWRWISKYTYTQIQQALIARFQPPRALQLAGPDAGPQEYLLVRGRMDLESGAVHWLPFQWVQLAEPPEPPAPGPFTLRLLDGAGQLLADIPFEPALDQPDDPAEHGSEAGFLIPVPFALPVAEVVLFHQAAALASRQASASPPAVQVLTPNGGETLGPGPWLVQWQGQDSDGDALTYLVQYSPDEGATWHTLAADWSEPALEVFPEDVPGSTTGGRIRVIASDGFRVGGDTSDAPFHVPNHPPRVWLQLPPANESFSRDQQVLFEAEALDIEDGSLPEERIVWTSSRDGVLGAGRFLSREATALSEGIHTITVTATDQAGLSRQATVSIEIAREPRPRLGLRRDGTRVTLSWEGHAWDYQLEVATRLAPADWRAVTEPAALVEDRWSVQLEVEVGTRFYRLRRP